METRLSEIFPEQCEYHDDEWGVSLTGLDGIIKNQSIKGGSYVDARLIVVEFDGNLYGFEAGLHEEIGWINGLDGTWGETLKWDSKVELKLVEAKHVTQYEIVEPDED